MLAGVPAGPEADQPRSLVAAGVSGGVAYAQQAVRRSLISPRIGPSLEPPWNLAYNTPERSDR